MNHLRRLKQFAPALIFLCLAGRPAAAEDVTFAPTLPAKTLCEVDLNALHPTQFALGMKEVEIRAGILHHKTPEELAIYLRKHRIPLVIGPEGVPYLIDGQHMARAVLVAGIKSPLPAEVITNLSSLSVTDFWDKMKAEHWTYLFDETGKGPLPAANLPASVAAMHDDPYRSLAWLVRGRAGYEKGSDESVDFQWANFFRTRIPFNNTLADNDGVISNAVALAHSPAAQGLPGYIGTPAKSAPARHAAP
jgi:hypothetical protein